MLSTPIMTHNAEELDEAGRRQAAWLRDNAASVAAVQPAWADSAHTEVDFEHEDDGDNAEGILFSRRVGEVAIEQMFAVRTAGIEPADKPQIWEEVDGHAIALDRAAHVGADLIRAAQILNGPSDVSATMFEIVGSALGISGADLYALADVEKDPENEISLGDLFRMSRYVDLTPTELYDLAQQNNKKRPPLRRHPNVDDELRGLDD